MKRLTNLLAALVFASLVIFMSCGKDDGNDNELTDTQEAALNLSTGTWTVDAADVTYNSAVSSFTWDGFTINFTLSEDGATGGTYTTNVDIIPETSDDGVDATAIWAQTDGTWELSSTTSMTKDSDESVTVTLSDSALTLTFSVDTPSAREAGVFEETWVFPFSK